MLEGLALQNASGVLEIEGRPSGAIYLDRGQLTFARASWSPELGARLAGSLQPSAGLRDLLLGGDQPDSDLGDLLVERGYLSSAELQATLVSVVVDAIVVLTVPLTDEASVTDIRFEAGQGHWAGALCQLGVDSVRAEAQRRADRMTRYDLPYDVRIELRDLTGPWAVLTPAQWTAASKINGRLTTWDLAWQCGLALCDTIEAVGGLVQSGLCAPARQQVRPARRGQRPQPGNSRSLAAELAHGRVARRPAGPAAAPMRAAARPVPSDPVATGIVEEQQQEAAVSQAALVADEPDTEMPTRESKRGEGGSFTPLPLDSLRRVLDGLRRLT